ncbi:hybrid sensor histidine kinase/response regulator [Pseudomonas sp. GD03944]|uniref:hybrid sensor histidine kinase/response regulator n=1 Tax=Pseudomonas sp. GD03944 TaxID=2975409 RepID=UPI002449359E|nr:hybrid sensor histidine kinase/response regulator [Pseudomonas sp. GD03944]MDH1265875.1 ATP-binding protein [Pseudomonas sp. GD03944]
MPPRATRHPLRQWIWRAFVQSALIPLILVESVLIAVYLLSNEAIRDAQIGHLQQGALEDLSAAVEREVQVIDSRLGAVESQAQIFRDAAVQAVLNEGFQPDALEVGRHRMTDSGVFYSHSDDGRAASFYANSTPAAQQDHAKALRLSQLDPLMRSIRSANPLVAATYINTWDSYNRIYPFFITPEQYPHDMVIPDFNFYYLADATHNPGRKVMWTDVYLDPAGLGWMMSAVAPVYRGDFLEGVVGLDITVGQMLAEIGELNVPWQGYAMLVSRDNNIMALPQDGEADFGLRELTQYSYAEAVHREVLKPEDFNLSRRPDLQPLLDAMNSGGHNVQEVLLGGRKQLVAWSEIPQTGWRLLLVVDEEHIFSETNRLAERYLQIGYLLIAGLGLFYLLFFAWMWVRSRRLSDELVLPINGIIGMMRRLGLGDFHPSAPATQIDELAFMAQAVQQTGEQLQASEVKRHEAQRLLEVVLESTTESLWEVDTTSVTITLSERFVKRYGLASECMSFSEFNQRVHPDDLERIRHLRQLFAVSGEDRFESEYRYANARGEYAWLLSRGRVLERDAEGQALRVAGTHVDITRLKQVQEKLRHASLEAQEASQAKSRFLSSMSHELRTPLNAIYGFGQLIEMEAQDKPGSQQEADYAREIVNASRHLTSLVDDILDLSSIESRRQQLQLQAVEIGALLNGCAELVQPEVQQRRLQLQVVAAADTGLYVQADMRRLRQVILNLLSNAIKYNSPQGLISMGYEVRPACVRLWVEDTGPGLTAAQQVQLFQPFQRLGRENSSIPGTGIGLVLCRELATLMGGDMGFQSVVGRGSRFWIDLPGAAPPPPAVPSDAPGDLEEPLKLADVLCVEDHPACTKVVQEALREFAAVRGAGSVQRALAELAQSTPTLVLLDLDLPDGNGLQVLDAMRRDLRLQAVPVMVISATVDEAGFAEARRRGAQACLAKPIELAQVRRLALSLLGQGL